MEERKVRAGIDREKGKSGFRKSVRERGECERNPLHAAHNRRVK